MAENRKRNTTKFRKMKGPTKGRRKKVYKKRFSRFMQKKLLFLFAVITIVLFGLNIRLTLINMNKGEDYTRQVLAQQRYESKAIPYQRGNITDRSGVVLATSIKVYNLILDPNIMISDEGKYLNTTLKALNGCFGYDIAELNSIISANPNSRYIVYKKQLSYEEIEQFVNLKSGNTETRPEWFPEEEYKIANIQGVWFEEEYKREYPYSALACDLIGYTNSGNVGSWGIEQYYNTTLNGTNGRTYGYLNSDSALEKVIKSPIDGNTIITTIDINLQMIIERHIQEYYETVGAKNIAIMIMDPNNGEILAEASAPTFDLNNPRDLSGYFTEEDLAAMSEEDKSNFLYSLWKNFTISELYEPGSTGKPFTVAAGFEEGKLLGNETFNCTGYRWVGGHQIFCHVRAGEGLLTLEESVKYSCNVAMMDIALDMGVDIFSKYQHIFGFDQKTHIDLPGEENSIIYSRENMDLSSLATNAFGQNYSVTMTQMVAAFSSLINGGYYYEPHVVRKIVDPSGSTIKTAESVLVRETVSRETSRTLREYLYHTVEEGTGSKSKVEGYAIGGKTGTAEKQPRDKQKYLVSFICFAPIDDPQMVLYIVIDEPNIPKQSDASQCTIMSNKILQEVLPYMGIFKENPATPDIPEGENETSEGQEEPVEEETTEPQTDENGETLPPRATPRYEEIYEEGGFMGNSESETETTSEETTSEQ